ncbi:ArsR/SmtB family transcription factor [Longispora albida]|uniref:ArsR/SmtB family transcription factor n=1 Tax=Longispora albida TaxID=203523 RepID=UPI0003630F85|nr:helix-turn-helix domain-containing protein [Longispora albida]
MVQDVGTLKALADPIRLTVLELTMSDHRRSWTAKELASAVRVPPTKIYYHLNTLEQHGLLEVRTTRVINGIIEKHYGAGQKMLSYESGPGPSGGMDELIAAMIDQVRDNIVAGIRSGEIVAARDAPDETRVIVSHAISSVPPAQAGEFRRRLLELVEEFHDGNDPANPSYQLLIALHPVASAPNGSGKPAELDEQ